jgi:hypothetical protein
MTTCVVLERKGLGAAGLPGMTTALLSNYSTYVLVYKEVEEQNEFFKVAGERRREAG